MSDDLDFVLSDLGCKHVTAEFFLRFIRGFSLIRCSALEQHLCQWMGAVVDAVRGGLTIAKIEIGLHDSEILHPFTCMPTLTHRPHLVLKFQSSIISAPMVSILSNKFSVEMHVVVHPDESLQRQSRGESAELATSMRRVAFPQALTTLQIRCMIVIPRADLTLRKLRLRCDPD